MDDEKQGSQERERVQHNHTQPHLLLLQLKRRRGEVREGREKKEKEMWNLRIQSNGW